MKGRLVSFTPLGANAGRLTLDIESDFRERYDELKDKELDITIERWYNKRSLNANAYCWALITEIANVLRTDKQSVYIEMLKRYGQGCLVYVPDGNEIVLREFKYFELDEVGQNGSYYHVWVGSSQYNTREMSILIDGIVSEAKELGIETATPDELALMKSLWATENP